MNILYEDKDIIVVEKPAGMPVQTSSITQKDMVSELKNHLHAKNGGSYLGVIHRLDQPVKGIVVFAVNEKAAGKLSRQISAGIFDKHYYAVVEGIIEPHERKVLEDHLIKTKENTAKVAAKGTKDAKKAVLSYTVTDINRDKEITLLDIELMTGRFHQIRAQLSHAGHPIVGDVKYGAKTAEPDRSIRLCAYRLSFEHPRTGKKMDFELDIRKDGDSFWDYTDKQDEETGTDDQIT